MKAVRIAYVSRRQGPVPEPAEPNGDWVVELRSEDGADLGHFEFDKPGTYRTRTR